MISIAVPTIVYLAVGSMHVAQQMVRNKALRIVESPETDFIVQALVMACIMELLCQHNLQVVAWTLTAPALLVSLLLVFYFVMYQCSL